MPASTVTATVSTAHGSEPHTYTGVLLSDLLATVGVSATAGQKSLGMSVSVMASDHHWATFSLAELDSQLGSTSALVAYQQDGQFLEASGMAELVVPSDKQTDRWVKNIVSMYVYEFSRSAALWANPTGQPDTSFQVTGFVRSPLTLTLPDLQAMPMITTKTTEATAQSPETHTYTGVRLTDLLHLRSGTEQESIGMSVSVLPADGDWVTFSLAELDPKFGGSTPLIAYEQDGNLLGDDGMAELIVPSDKEPARWVKNIVSVYVYYPFPASHG
jgi:hypothetical protein